MPNNTLLVSPCSMTMSSSGMPSLSATTWAKVVSWPWPWLWLPVRIDTEPVGFTRTVAASQPPAE